jgi:uncharacterized protein (TIGR02246 family)
MTRTPENVFFHDAEAMAAGDLDQIVADYADDAVFITPTDVVRGKDGIRAAMAQLLDELPNASWDFKTQIHEGDVLLFEWAADSVFSHVDDGVDTVVGDGLIRVQTARCTVQLKTQRDGQGHE